MIPARIGSTRFKMKNLALLNGKPMIAYAIMVALSSKVFDKVIVNSDSEVFRSIAKEYGAEFYLRPKHLGGSTVKSDDVVIDFIKKFPYDILVWENPIAPLQTIEDIQNTLQYFGGVNVGISGLIQPQVVIVLLIILEQTVRRAMDRLWAIDIQILKI